MTVDLSLRLPTADETSRFADATRDKAAHIYEVVDWVFQNVGLEWSIIDPDTCPCFGCVNMLQYAKTKPTAFYTLFYARLPDDWQSIANGPDVLLQMREDRIRRAEQNRFHRN